MIEFVSGLTTMGFAAAGLFFLRFWNRTNDVFFAFFAAAFWLFAINQAAAGMLRLKEDTSFAYLLRLTGFILIIVAIFSKNRVAARGQDMKGDHRRTFSMRGDKRRGSRNR